MIEFPCHCGYAFSVPEELAGGSLQCPECHWLNEIPTLSELKSILPDGTYDMDKPEPNPPQRLADTFLAFTRGTYDPLGNEIDLRQTSQDLSRVGIDVNEPLHVADSAKQPPKYDPETGELIRPLKVTLREQDGPIEIPMAKAALGYALPGMNRRVSPWQVYLELFRPANAIVMSFIFLFHLMVQVMLIAMAIIIPIVGLAFLIAAIIAHYGCVVEEVGREERDELPRPLRDLNLIEDVWWPFCNVMAALLLCYAPALVARERIPHDSLLYFFVPGFLSMAGTIFIPAVLLTLLTSGTAANLRPDRLLRVISIAGPGYVLLVLGWVIAFSIYALGVASLNIAVSVQLIARTTSFHKLVWVGIVVVLIAGIYLMHAFCWQLGLLYRAKHAAFPWVYQHHIRRPKPERTKSRRLPKV